MKLNRKWILVLSLVLSVAIATGSTLAYLMDTTDPVTNTFTIGDVSIELTEPEWDKVTDHRLYPGATVVKDPTITNTGWNNAYVWMKLDIDEKLYPHIELDLNEGWQQVKDDTNSTIILKYTKEALEKGESATAFDSITMNANVTSDEFKALAGSANIVITGHAIEADPFENFDAAYNQGAYNADVVVTLDPNSTTEVVTQLQNAIGDAIATGKTDILIDAANSELRLSKAFTGKAKVEEGTTVTIKNAKISGYNDNNILSGGKVVFKNCTINNPGSEAHSMHFGDGSGEVNFIECEIKGWTSFGAGYTVNLTGCDIQSNEVIGTVKIFGKGTLTKCKIDFSGTADRNKPFYIAAADSGANVTLDDCTIIDAELWADEGATLSAGGTIGELTNRYVLVQNNDIAQEY